MKTYLILFTLLLSGLVVKAQSANNTIVGHPAASVSGSSGGFDAPGCVELGGSISYSGASEQTGGVNSTELINEFSITPYVGYFPIKGFELGLNPISYTDITAGGYNTTSLHVLFAPAYNFNTSTIVHFFVEGEIGFNRNTNIAYSQLETGVSYGGRLGMKIEIAPHAMLNIYFQFLNDDYNYMNNSPYPYPYAVAESSVISNLIVGVGFTEALYK